MIQQGQVFKLKATCADGEPLWAYRYRVAGRGSARLQVGGFSSKAEAQRALQSKAGSAPARPPCGGADARRVGRGVPGRASGRAGHGREAPLAAREGDRRAGRSASCRALAGAGLRVAADRSGRAPLRSDPGAAAGAESGGCVEADRREPGQAWGAESWPALPGAAAVRFLGADPVGRRAARADVRADGRVRGRDRASTLGAVRARAGRRRSCRRRRPGPTGVCERTGQADRRRG